MYCLHCRCRRDGNFCGYCGSKLFPQYPSQLKCDCGKQIDLLNNYCDYCGKRIETSLIIDKLIEELEEKDKAEVG